MRGEREGWISAGICFLTFPPNIGSENVREDIFRWAHSWEIYFPAQCIFFDTKGLAFLPESINPNKFKL